MIHCPECKKKIKTPWVIDDVILHAECKYCKLEWNGAIDLSAMEVNNTRIDALSDVYFG